MAGDGDPEPAALLVNGRPTGTIAVEDRGLLYGDGLFETVAVRGGRPCLWQAHLGRLAAGAARLGIPLPDPDLLRRESRLLLDGAGNAVLKVILTRGSGPRGYRAPVSPRPTRILIRYPAMPGPDHWLGPGVAVRLCSLRLGTNPALAGLKHLNRLEQVMARSEWDDPDIAEGLLCDVGGRLIGGTMTNLFLVRDGRLLTPRVDQAGVAGTVRGRVLHHAGRLGIRCDQRRLHTGDLGRADGAFLTNALTGCRPVSRVDARALDPASMPAELLSQVQQETFRPEPEW